MLKLAIIGFGAIGQELAKQLSSDLGLEITQIVVGEQAVEAARQAAARLGLRAEVRMQLDLGEPQGPGLVVECAGHAAVMSHVLDALQAGVPCVVASVGALHEGDSWARLEDAARHGGTRVRLISGAIGAIDALASAHLGGIEKVSYIGRKPPTSWLGTPAERICDLHRLTDAFTIFRGNAREASSTYPKNANVAATVGLAGVGMEETRVELIADPAVTRNVHMLEVVGAFGTMNLRLENFPLAANPKTSALTVYSLARAVKDSSARICF